MSVLTTRLERVGRERFHYHRALMRIRWAIENEPPHMLFIAIDAILNEVGYTTLETEEAA